jgi:hypothetical protein
VVGIVDTVTLRVHGRLPVASLAEPLVVAIGARAGLDVLRLDELVTALELVSRATLSDSPRTVTVDLAQGGVEVTIEPVETDLLRDRRVAIDALVQLADVHENRVRLRVGD